MNKGRMGSGGGRESNPTEYKRSGGGGRESNPPTGMSRRTGFEDREGHQSPFASGGTLSPGGDSWAQCLACKSGVSDTGPVMRRRGNAGGSTQDGFSLIELLVVIVIVAILAAIAIPIYLSQREKAQIVSIQSTLKSAATHVEGFAVDFSGDYSTLDEQPASVLTNEGYKDPWWAASPGYVTIEADRNRYCIQAQHKELSPTNEWRRSTLDSDNPRPLESPDVCPELTP